MRCRVARLTITIAVVLAAPAPAAAAIVTRQDSAGRTITFDVPARALAEQDS